MFHFCVVLLQMKKGTSDYRVSMRHTKPPRRKMTIWRVSSAGLSTQNTQLTTSEINLTTTYTVTFPYRSSFTNFSIFKKTQKCKIGLPLVFNFAASKISKCGQATSHNSAGLRVSQDWSNVPSGIKDVSLT